MNSSVIIISVVFILVYCISVVVQDRNERRRKAIESTFWWQYETYLTNPDKLIKCEEMKRVFGIIGVMFNRSADDRKTKEFIFGKTLAVGIPPDFYKNTLNIPLPRNKDDVYRMWSLIWRTTGLTLPLKNSSYEVQFAPTGKITMCLINFDEQEIEEGVFIDRVSTSDVTRIIGGVGMTYGDLLDALTQGCVSTPDVNNMNTENFALSVDSRKIIETAKKRLNNQGVNK